MKQKLAYKDSSLTIKKVSHEDRTRYHIFREKKGELYFVGHCKDFDSVMHFIRTHEVTKYQIKE